MCEVGIGGRWVRLACGWAGSAGGPVATAAGAATIFGSSDLGSILGVFFVAAAPVGWMIGTAASDGLPGYAAIKMIRSGTKSDVIKDGHIAELGELISDRQSEVVTRKDLEDATVAVIDLLQVLIAAGEISQEKSTKLLAGMQACRQALSNRAPSWSV